MKFLILYLILLPSLLGAKESPTFSMGALGDSITTGFNSYHILSDHDGSWSTGNNKYPDFESHKMKLEKLLEMPIQAVNVAIPGTTSKSLKKQVRRLLKKAPKPDYVTLLIGANDACRWKEDYSKDLEEYKKNVSAAVSKIALANSKVKILLVPVPDMNRLYELGKENKKCQIVWNLLPLCKPLLTKKVTDNQRDEFSQRIKDLNAKLKEVSTEYPNNAFYYDFIAEIEYDEEHISEIDCFHPSAYGQKMIAEFTFNRDLFTEWLPTTKKSVATY